MGGPDWHVLMFRIHLQILLLVHCSGQAGVKGNDRADRLAGKAAITSDLCVGRSEVLRSLRHYLRAQSQGHHTTDRLKERGVEREIPLERTREGHRLSDERWNCFKDNVGETSGRRDEAPAGCSERI